jgi:hypothetical protein
MQTPFSKRQFLLIIFLGNSFVPFSQSKQDTIAISNCVVKEGRIYSFPEPYLSYTNPVQFISIVTDEDSVFSVSDGIVKSVFRIDNSDFIMIESKDAWYTYGYTNFSGLKKADTIANGQFLGIVSKIEFEEKNIVFAICPKSKESINCLSYIDLYNYLKRYKK